MSHADANVLYVLLFEHFGGVSHLRWTDPENE